MSASPSGQASQQSIGGKQKITTATSWEFRTSLARPSFPERPWPWARVRRFWSVLWEDSKAFLLLPSQKFGGKWIFRLLICHLSISWQQGHSFFLSFQRKANKTSDTMNDFIIISQYQAHHQKRPDTTKTYIYIRAAHHRFCLRLLALANGQGPVLLLAPIPFHPFHLHWQRSCAQWTVALPNCSRGLRFSEPSAVDHLMRAKMLLAAWMVFGEVYT